MPFIHNISMRYFLLPLILVLMSLLHHMGVFSPAGRWLYPIVLQEVYQKNWKVKAESLGIYSNAPVLIAIDDFSLKSLGRWPWSRTIHAQLQTILNSSAIPPAVLAWDILFSEPQILGANHSIIDADRLFVNAINQSKYPTILAIDFELNTPFLQWIMPHTPFSDSRAKIAHVHIRADLDGTIRQYLSTDKVFNPAKKQGIPYLGVGLFAPHTAPAINLNNPFIDDTHVLNKQVQQLNKRFSKRLLDTNQAVTFYPMPNNWIKTVSYSAVLSKQISEKIWANTPVLVAATAQGLGDQYVSFINNESNIVAGGELVLAAYHTEKMIQAGFPQLYTASNTVQLGWMYVIAICVFVGFRHIKQFSLQLAWVSIAILSVSFLIWYRLSMYGEWLNPWSMYAVIILIWLLWLVNKMQILLLHVFKQAQFMHDLQFNQKNKPIFFENTVLNTAFLAYKQSSTVFKLSKQSKFISLNKQQNKFSDQLIDKPHRHNKSHKQSILMEDSIDQTIKWVNALENRTLFEFIRINEVLHLMPDATLVFSSIETSYDSTSDSIIDNSGLFLRLNHYNKAAQRLIQQYAQMEKILALPNISLNELLLNFSPDLTPEQIAVLSEISPNSINHFMWNLLLADEYNQHPAFIQGIEAVSSNGLRYLIKWVCISANNSNIQAQSHSVPVNPLWNLNCYVLSMVDLSVSLSLSKHRDQTLNFLSHDLRSPQTTILALIDLHKKQYSNINSEYMALFKHIEFQAKRTLDLSEGFVQWSQANHGETYQFIEYNLNDLMIEAIDELWANAKQKNIQLVNKNDLSNYSLNNTASINNTVLNHQELNNQAISFTHLYEEEIYETNTDLWVKIDRNLMWRSIVNLITNALNIAQSGTTIYLNTYKKNQYAVLSVTDEGIGIPKDLQPYLFQPFKQGKGLKRKGAGLGLAFVKTVCEQHHGYVQVISPVFLTPNPYGTCFELYIPLMNKN